MMTDFPRPPGVTAPTALRRKKSESAKPPSASPPALKKLRRETPAARGPVLGSPPPEPAGA